MFIVLYLSLIIDYLSQIVGEINEKQTEKKRNRPQRLLNGIAMGIICWLKQRLCAHCAPPGALCGLFRM